MSVNAWRGAALAVAVGGAVALAVPGAQAAASGHSLGTATAGTPKVVGTTVIIPVSCPSEGSYCSVDGSLYVRVKGKRLAIGFGEKDLDAGKSGKVRVGLLKAGRQYLKAHGQVRAKLVVESNTQPPGPTGINNAPRKTLVSTTVTLNRTGSKR